MVTVFKDDKVCIRDDCRHLPRDGPIPFLEFIRLDIRSLIKFSLLVLVIIVITTVVFFIMREKKKTKTASDILQDLGV